MTILHAWLNMMEAPKMLQLVSCMGCSLFVSELCFILLSKLRSTEEFRYIPLFACIVCVMFVAIKVRMSLSYVQVARISVCSSVVFVALHQFIGHVWFPGIVKDIDFLSLENAWVSLCLAMSVATLLFICFASFKIVSRLVAAA